MGDGGGMEMERRGGSEAVIFLTAIVSRNKETSSLVPRGWGYLASATWLTKEREREREMEGGRERDGTIGEREVPSQARLFFCHLLLYKNQEKLTMIS